jgi:hypothetical protein
MKSSAKKTLHKRQHLVYGVPRLKISLLQITRKGVR